MVKNNYKMKGILVCMLLFYVLASVSPSEPSHNYKWLPIKAMSCGDCIDSIYFEDCAYYYCRDELFNNQALSLVSGRMNANICKNCLELTGNAYFTCINSYCQSCIQDVAKLMKGSDLKSFTSEQCANTCYWDSIKFGFNYANCYNSYCKKLEIGLSSLYTRGTIYKLGQKLMNDCDACYYYYYGEDFYSCIEVNCKKELPILEESKQLKEINLKSDLLESSKKKLNMSKHKPDIKLYGCQWCAFYYTDYAYEDCIINHCRSEIIDNLKLKSSEKLIQGQVLSACTDKCFDEYYHNGADYDDCVSDNCKKELINEFELFSSQDADILNFKSSLELNKCGGCYGKVDPNESFDCMWRYCKAEITNKASLFSDKNEFNLFSACSRCQYTEDLDEYDDCVYYNCRKEVLLKSLNIAVKSPKLISTNLDVKTCKCEECSNSYHNNGDIYTYQCILANCKAEIINKDILFSS